MNDGFPVGVLALADALQQRQLSATQAARYYLDRIATHNPSLNAYITVTDDLAMQQAHASDERRARNKSFGLLDGIPIALKDNIDVAGVTTTAGIAARRHHAAQTNASVTAKLRTAGAVLLGKTNMHEAALGATTDNPHFGRCHNPLRYGHTPGGSSGGSGAAVAARLCAAALGTDTLGSVRVPAAYCGCYGFKPTTGLISNRGVVPLSWTLDHVGPLTTKVEDLKPLLSVLSGYDAQSADSVKSFASEYSSSHPITSLRIGYIDGLQETVELDTSVQQSFAHVLERLDQSGTELVKVDFKKYDFTRMRRSGLLISEAEASVVYAEAIAANPQGYSEDLRNMLDWGGRQSAHKLARAYRDIRETILLGRRIFHDIDVLMLPTTPQAAFSFDQPVPVNQADLTSFANLARCPAVSLPVEHSDEALPVGLQLVAPEWQDDLLLSMSAELAAFLNTRVGIGDI